MNFLECLLPARKGNDSGTRSLPGPDQPSQPQQQQNVNQSRQSIVDFGQPPSQWNIFPWNNNGEGAAQGQAIVNNRMTFSGNFTVEASQTQSLNLNPYDPLPSFPQSRRRARPKKVEHFTKVYRLVDSMLCVAVEVAPHLPTLGVDLEDLSPDGTCAPLQGDEGIITCTEDGQKQLVPFIDVAAELRAPDLIWKRRATVNSPMVFSAVAKKFNLPLVPTHDGRTLRAVGTLDYSRFTLFDELLLNNGLTLIALGKNFKTFSYAPQAPTNRLASYSSNKQNNKLQSGGGSGGEGEVLRLPGYPGSNINDYDDSMTTTTTTTTTTSMKGRSTAPPGALGGASGGAGPEGGMVGDDGGREGEMQMHPNQTPNKKKTSLRGKQQSAVLIQQPEECTCSNFYNKHVKTVFCMQNTKGNSNNNATMLASNNPVAAAGRWAAPPGPHTQALPAPPPPQTQRHQQQDAQYNLYPPPQYLPSAQQPHQAPPQQPVPSTHPYPSAYPQYSGGPSPYAPPPQQPIPATHPYPPASPSSAQQNPYYNYPPTAHVGSGVSAGTAPPAGRTLSRQRQQPPSASPPLSTPPTTAPSNKSGGGVGGASGLDRGGGGGGAGQDSSFLSFFPSSTKVNNNQNNVPNPPAPTTPNAPYPPAKSTNTNKRKAPDMITYADLPIRDLPGIIQNKVAAGNNADHAAASPYVNPYATAVPPPPKTRALSQPPPYSQPPPPSSSQQQPSPKQHSQHPAQQPQQPNHQQHASPATPSSTSSGHPQQSISASLVAQLSTVALIPIKDSSGGPPTPGAASQSQASPQQGYHQQPSPYGQQPSPQSYPYPPSQPPAPPSQQQMPQRRTAPAAQPHLRRAPPPVGAEIEPYPPTHSQSSQQYLQHSQQQQPPHHREHEAPVPMRDIHYSQQWEERTPSPSMYFQQQAPPPPPSVYQPPTPQQQPPMPYQQQPPTPQSYQQPQPPYSGQPSAMHMPPSPMFRASDRGSSSYYTPDGPPLQTQPWIQPDEFGVEESSLLYDFFAPLPQNDGQSGYSTTTTTPPNNNLSATVTTNNNSSSTNNTNTNSNSSTDVAGGRPPESAAAEEEGFLEVPDGDFEEEEDDEGGTGLLRQFVTYRSN